MLRIASYNVHRCVGRDGRCSPDRIARVIDEVSPDVVALQEVEADETTGWPRDQFEDLSSATGLSGIEGPALVEPPLRYGNAVLTRLPVRGFDRIEFGVPGREPRGALRVDLDADGRRLRVISTHLGLRRSERRFQARQLLAWIEREGRRAPADLLVLAGDINEWLPCSGALRLLRAGLGAQPASPPTFPAHWPCLRLDRIWVKPAEALAHVRTHRSALARVASDHLPLRVELRLPHRTV
jgi:endonuclease/exonuclease/phosphatase family metal-dependent hydrolase